MQGIEGLARLDKHIRPLLVSVLPSKTLTAFYSKTRPIFQKQLVRCAPTIIPFIPPAELSRTLWGIEFRSPILNAAGMYKNGEGYPLVAAQGAGGYLSGTTTSRKRAGNSKADIYLPFAPYPRSRAASNWLGLPNDGDEVIAKRLAEITRLPGCPVGASIMGDPDLADTERHDALLHGLEMYRAANVDFIEINESCPNTAEGKPQENDLARRLRFISKNFLQRTIGARQIPLIVKFSTDTELAQVPALLQLLFDLGFSGVNFGNTSTQYSRHAASINPREWSLYNFYTQTFGGGVSGAPLKGDSLSLVKAAAEYLRTNRPQHEFHIIRTGGIETATDVRESLNAGASLTQWYTGYFEAFARDGHQVYQQLYREL